ERVRALLDRVKAAEKELARLRTADLSQAAAQVAREAERSDGLAIVVHRLDGVSMDDLRAFATQVRGELGTAAVVIVGSATPDGKAQLIGAVTADLLDRGVQAREVLQPAARIVGGGAGGKGDL